MISVIIPSYNRYDSLLLAIKSVKEQTYKNIEIIIINDNSTDTRYYSKIEGCNLVHLEKNSRVALGIKNNPYGGRSRNYGLKIAQGDYIAFLDDDDYWMPTKIEHQLRYIENTNTGFSCTEGYYGIGAFTVDHQHILYNKEKYWQYLKNKLNLENDFPDIINKKLLEQHNMIINSSVLVSRDICNKVGYIKEGCFAEDYDYWLRCLDHSDCCYVKIPLIYYGSKK